MSVLIDATETLSGILYLQVQICFPTPTINKDEKMYILWRYLLNYLRFGAF